MKANTKFKKGDIVLISPEVTHQIDWIEGTIIEIECLFKSVSEELCLQ